MPTIKFKPSHKQAKCWEYLTDDKTTEIGYGGAAGGGKSYLMCYWLTIMCLQYPRTRYGFGRKELKTLKRTTLMTLFKVFAECGINEKWYKYNQQQDVITFKNGSQIFLVELTFQPRDPHYTRFGGMELTGAAVDESNECSAESIDILSSRLGRCMNNEYGLKPKLLETFNPDKSHVYRRFHKPEKDGKLPPQRQFIRALATDNPTVTQDYIEQLKKLDKTAVERLLYGNFDYDDSPDALMDYDSIVDLFTNEHVKGDGMWYISADIARFGKDLTTIMVWNGWVLEDVETIATGDLIHVGNEIKKLCQRYGIPMSQVIVDEDGVGGGVKDYLKCKGFVSNKSPIKRANAPDNFNNMKSQCYFHLATLVNKKEIYLKVHQTQVKDALIEELGVVKKHNIDKLGKNAVLPKETVKDLIGRSPDYSDAMMMRCWFDLNHNPTSYEFL
jgi:hypothetical protein